MISFSAVTVTLNPAIDRTVRIPSFTTGEVNRVEAFNDKPAGKGVNVASALADWGLHTAVTGFLGTENAALFDALFSTKQIEDHFIRLAGSARIGIKIIDSVHKQTTDINFPGLPPARADIMVLRVTLASLESPWWILAGSLPPGIDSAIYRDIIVDLKARGANVVLDASGEALRHGIDAGPQIVKPNLAELEALLGKPIANTEALLSAAHELLAKDIEMVVVSMGGDGACFVTASEAIVARPPAVEVQSTVGAGDAMVAGIVASKILGLPLDGCAQLATAFSLDLLTRSEPGCSSRQAIEFWATEIHFERL